MTAAYPSMGVTAHREVVSLELHLTPGHANDLYNEVYALLRDRGIHTAHDRHKADLPALYALYDALYRLDIDGSGPSAREVAS
jgi:hypothetical protein